MHSDERSLCTVCGEHREEEKRAAQKERKKRQKEFIILKQTRCAMILRSSCMKGRRAGRQPFIALRVCMQVSRMPDFYSFLYIYFYRPEWLQQAYVLLIIRKPNKVTDC